jgi:gag-polypeptide of LTR copia-type
MADFNQKGSVAQSLTNFLLNGENYMPWARAVKLALHGRGKLNHILGKPADVSTTKDDPKKSDKKEKDVEWEASDSWVMSWILNSMEPKIYGIFVYSNTAEEMWKSIYEMYGNPKNSARVFEIQQSIASLKQAQDQPFMEHFGHFKQRLDELRQYIPVANSVQVYIKREEQDKIHNLLASLTPDFEEVRRDILLRRELPSLNTVCAIIHNEETRKRVMKKVPR